MADYYAQLLIQGHVLTHSQVGQLRQPTTPLLQPSGTRCYTLLKLPSARCNTLLQPSSGCCYTPCYSQTSPHKAHSSDG